MKKTMLLYLLIALSGAVSAQDRRAAQIDSMMSFAAGKGLFNGVLCVAEKGNMVYHKSFGYANYDTKEPVSEHTLFNLCSVTKQFTAMGILMLMERGKLGLDDSLRQYFPELPYSGVTLRHMLHHTSGLPDYMMQAMQHWDEDNEASNKEAIALLAANRPPVLFQPGDKFQYCNTGYILLATVIEQVSGMSYADFLQQNMFDPLGMVQSKVYRTVFDESKQRGIAYGYILDMQQGKMVLPENDPRYRKQVNTLTGTYGDGGVFSSSSDMWKWENALKTEQLVKKSTMEAAFTSGLLNNGQTAGYGFGWFVSRDAAGRKMVVHTGGWPGYRNAFIRYPDQDISILVLRNNEVEFMGIQPAVVNILEGKPFEMPKSSLAQALAIEKTGNK